LTIEHRSEIPAELREAMGDWLFGCDLCQDVCPWNQKAPVVADPAFEPAAALNPIDLLPLFDLSEEAFRQQFRGTPLMRAGRAGILRNAAIVLGNQRNRRAIPVLMRALTDASPLVRSAAEWALARLQG
jgi:epoxyqueuosine reductase